MQLSLRLLGDFQRSTRLQSRHVIAAAKVSRPAVTRSQRFAGFTTSATLRAQQQQSQQQNQQRRESAAGPPAQPSKPLVYKPTDVSDHPVSPKANSQSPQTIHEDIYTLPNLLTFTRLAAAPVVGYLVLHDFNAWAVGLFAYAGATDVLDGWIARRWDRKTVVGTVIDPMADKALMTILTVCLAAKGALPMWVAAIILGRDVGLAFAAIYYRWVSLPPPKTFFRYWDFSLPSAEVRPTTISKYNTFLQLALVGLTTTAPLLTADISSILSVMQYVVATTTVWSGASYVFSKDAVKILGKAKPGPSEQP